jgi:hypothetical protein
MGDSIRVSELNIDSKKFEILNNSEDVVVTASKPKKVEEVKVEETETESK